jgi:hypothetical protein
MFSASVTVCGKVVRFERNVVQECKHACVLYKPDYLYASWDEPTVSAVLEVRCALIVDLLGFEPWPFSQLAANVIERHKST